MTKIKSEQMKIMIKRILALFSALILMASLLSCAKKEDVENDTATSATQNDSKMPDFTVFTESGEKVTLYEKLDRPVVINFWATWCPPCKSELPAFENLSKEYGDHVEFMMVNLTDGERETVDTVLEFLKDNGYTFPVYYDTRTDAAVKYRVSSIPLTIFMTEDGVMTDYHVGAMTEDILRGYIDELIK